jgi:protease I
MKKIGIFLENRFIEKEIIYYQHRFPEAGVQVDFLTRLWGQPRLIFKGLEFGMEFSVDKSFEELDDRQMSEYAAFIVPAGYVADMLRYSETAGGVAPAVDFMRRAMLNKDIVKGIICHSVWIFDPIPDSIKGRRITCHNNVVGSARNAGAIFADEDYCRDDDLLSARTGGHFAGFAERIIKLVV